MPLIHILATTSINVYVKNAVTMQRKHFVMLRFKSFKAHLQLRQCTAYFNTRNSVFCQQSAKHTALVCLYDIKYLDFAINRHVSCEVG